MLARSLLVLGFVLLTSLLAVGCMPRRAHVGVGYGPRYVPGPMYYGGYMGYGGVGYGGLGYGRPGFGPWDMGYGWAPGPYYYDAYPSYYYAHPGARLRPRMVMPPQGRSPVYAQPPPGQRGGVRVLPPPGRGRLRR
jgi:hypothetical protein